MLLPAVNLPPHASRESIREGNGWGWRPLGDARARPVLLIMQVEQIPGPQCAFDEDNGRPANPQNRNSRHRMSEIKSSDYQKNDDHIA